MEPNAVEEGLERLRADTSSGAAELAAQAVELFRQLFACHRDASVGEYLGELRKLAARIIAAQPAMAPVVNLANRVLWVADGAQDNVGITEAVRRVCDEFGEELVLSRDLLAERGAEIIPDGKTVATYSRSSSVLEAFRTARKCGKHFEVLCSESRPTFEGITLANELARSGIRSKLLTDGGLFSALDEAAVVLIGADAVSELGVVNKTGSRGLAIIANTLRIPFYVLCGSLKFLPEGYPPNLQHDRGAAQIATCVEEGVTIVNEYFDLTPLHHVTGVISEVGVLDERLLLSRLRRDTLHPALLRAVAGP